MINQRYFHHQEDEFFYCYNYNQAFQLDQLGQITTQKDVAFPFHPTCEAYSYNITQFKNNKYILLNNELYKIDKLEVLLVNVFAISSINGTSTFNIASCHDSIFFAVSTNLYRQIGDNFILVKTFEQEISIFSDTDDIIILEGEKAHTYQTDLTFNIDKITPYFFRQGYILGKTADSDVFIKLDGGFDILQISDKIEIKFIITDYAITNLKSRFLLKQRENLNFQVSMFDFSQNTFSQLLCYRRQNKNVLEILAEQKQIYNFLYFIDLYQDQESVEYMFDKLITANLAKEISIQKATPLFLIYVISFYSSEIIEEHRLDNDFISKFLESILVADFKIVKRIVKQVIDCKNDQLCNQLILKYANNRKLQELEYTLYQEKDLILFIAFFDPIFDRQLNTDYAEKVMIKLMQIEFDSAINYMQNKLIWINSSPLIIAAQLGKIKYVKMFMDTDSQNGFKALKFAQNKEVIDILIPKFSKLNQNYVQSTKLMEVITSNLFNQLENKHILVQNQATIQDKNGMLASHIIISNQLPIEEFESILVLELPLFLSQNIVDICQSQFYAYSLIKLCLQTCSETRKIPFLRGLDDAENACKFFNFKQDAFGNSVNLIESTGKSDDIFGRDNAKFYSFDQILHCNFNAIRPARQEFLDADLQQIDQNFQDFMQFARIDDMFGQGIEDDDDDWEGQDDFDNFDDSDNSDGQFYEDDEYYD